MRTIRKSHCSLPLLLLLSVLMVIWQTTWALSDKRLCADPVCKTVISMGKTTVRYNAPDPRMLSFGINQKVRIYSKSAGKDPKYWEIEVAGRRGYAPKDLILEEKVLVKRDKVTFEVDVESADDASPSLPELKPSETNETESITTTPLDAVAVSDPPILSQVASSAQVTPVQKDAQIIDDTKNALAEKKQSIPFDDDDLLKEDDDDDDDEDEDDIKNEIKKEQENTSKHLIHELASEAINPKKSELITEEIANKNLENETKENKVPNIPTVNSTIEKGSENPLEIVEKSVNVESSTSNTSSGGKTQEKEVEKTGLEKEIRGTTESDIYYQEDNIIDIPDEITQDTSLNQNETQQQNETSANQIPITEKEESLQQQPQTDQLETQQQQQAEINVIQPVVEEAKQYNEEKQKQDIKENEEEKQKLEEKQQKEEEKPKMEEKQEKIQKEEEEKQKLEEKQQERKQQEEEQKERQEKKQAEEERKQQEEEEKQKLEEKRQQEEDEKQKLEEKQQQEKKQTEEEDKHKLEKQQQERKQAEEEEKQKLEEKQQKERKQAEEERKQQEEEQKQQQEKKQTEEEEKYKLEEKQQQERKQAEEEEEKQKLEESRWQEEKKKQEELQQKLEKEQQQLEEKEKQEEKQKQQQLYQQQIKQTNQNEDSHRLESNMTETSEILAATTIETMPTLPLTDLKTNSPIEGLPLREPQTNSPAEESPKVPEPVEFDVSSQQNWQNPNEMYSHAHNENIDPNEIYRKLREQANVQTPQHPTLSVGTIPQETSGEDIPSEIPTRIEADLLDFNAKETTENSFETNSAEEDSLTTTSKQFVTEERKVGLFATILGTVNSFISSEKKELPASTDDELNRVFFSENTVSQSHAQSRLRKPFPIFLFLLLLFFSFL